MIKEATVIKLNNKLNKLKEINKNLRTKVKRQREQAQVYHDREDELKMIILNMKPDYTFDDSIKCKTKMLIRKRDNNLCCFCRKNIYKISTDETLHHKVPKRYGGTDKKDNQITICRDCHRLLEELILIVENKAIQSSQSNEKLDNTIKEKK